MVNILPMVKMYLFPFCKQSFASGFEPQIKWIRPCPFCPPNWASNYHEYQANWTLTTRSLPTDGCPTNLFSFLVLFLLPRNLWNSLCHLMIAPGGHGQGGNGLRDWSQSEAYNPICITRKPRRSCPVLTGRAGSFICFNRGQKKSFSQGQLPPKRKRPPPYFCCVQRKEKPSFRGNLTFLCPLGNF